MCDGVTVLRLHFTFVTGPSKFTYYVRDVISSTVNCGAGCHVGEYCMNLFAYADDMALLAPAWSAMQKIM